VSYKDYIVDESDFFNGVPTILTSEKAALSMTEIMYNKLKQDGQIFHDADFGPSDDNDVQGSQMSLYKKGTIPCPGYPEPSTIKWASAEEICEPGTTPQFVDDGAGANDVRQG
jgi:hypothetical protein